LKNEKLKNSRAASNWDDEEEGKGEEEQWGG